MKNLILVLFVLGAQSAQAEYIDGLIPEVCKVASKKDETVTCRALNADIVNAAKPDGVNVTPAVYAQLVKKGFKPMETDARDIGLMPDADTSGIYHYKRILRSVDGEVVGVMFIDGYVNTETEDKIQVSIRMNLAGKFTKVSVK